MKQIDLETFIDKYQPICNQFRPYGNKKVTDVLGHVVYDKKDYAMVAPFMGEKRLWTVMQVDNKVAITPGSYIVDKPEYLGYIVTECPFHINDMGNLEVTVKV